MATDFRAQLLAAKRQQALIDQLREAGGQTPRGQMVGKFYVPPSRGQMLVPALSSIGSTFLQIRQNEQDAARDTAMGQEADEWMRSRPQEREVEQPGPPTEEGVGPAPKIVKPTMQDNLAWAMQGQRNPLTQALAAKYGEDILVKEPEREQARAFKAQESALMRQMALDKVREQGEQRLQEIQLRLEDKGLDRESREKLEKQADETRRYIAQLMADARKDVANIAAAARTEAAATRAAASGNKPDKPLPSHVMNALRGMETQAEGVSGSASTFKDEYGGLSGAIDKVSGTWNPFSGKNAEAAANWWKTYELQSALVERHEKFGTALSAGERQAWADATIKPGMKPEIIKHNLKVRSDLANRLYERSRQEYIKGGYGAVKNAFAPRSKDRKVINGKEYYKVGDDWFTDED